MSRKVLLIGKNLEKEKIIYMNEFKYFHDAIIYIESVQATNENAYFEIYEYEQKIIFKIKNTKIKLAQKDTDEEQENK